jgi:hypothetical protein
MTPIYNQYLRPNISEEYVSEIAFINTNNPILSYKLFYVDFNKNINKKSGFFIDNNDYLRKIYIEITKDTNESRESIILRSSNNILTNIQPASKNFSYVKIINDIKNPQLNDQIMIFSFGQRIFNVITEYLRNEKYFNNTFKIKIQYRQGFLNYDNSFFTKNELTLTNLDLDLKNEIFFKQINVKQIEREEKLKKLTSDIELKNERYQEYLKLKEEFEK